MCRHLSSELHDFDIRKEQELKQVLIEYAESRFDVFEKVGLLLRFYILNQFRQVENLYVVCISGASKFLEQYLLEKNCSPWKNFKKSVSFHSLQMQSKWFGVKLILESEIVPSLRAIDFTNGHSS